MARKGRLIIFTGNGRGKTSAAFGLALRVLGNGMRVYLAQLMKGRPSGESEALRGRAGLRLEVFGSGGLIRKGKANACQVAAARRGLSAAQQALASRRYGMVVLDEALSACKLGLLTRRELVALASLPRGGCHLVLTGRGVPGALLAAADDVTVMRKLKHSYDGGRKAEKGLEY